MGVQGRLPESELDIMLVIWAKGRGVTAPPFWRPWSGPSRPAPSTAT